MEMRWRYITAYLILVLAYAVVTLTAPAAGNTFNLSRFTLGLLQLTIIVPIILIWLAGIRGVGHLHRYVEGVQDRGERSALNRVALGITILVTGLIVVTLAGTLRPYAITHGWVEPFRITLNYLNALFPLAGLYLVYRGSSRLLHTKPVRTVPLHQKLTLSAVLVGIFALLLFLLFQDEHRNTTPDPARYISYFLNDGLIIGTILIPYLVVWGLGSLAGLNLRTYARQTDTRLCQTGFNRVAYGVFAIVGISIMLQVFAMLSGVIGQLTLGPLLAVVYLLILFYGLGYVLIASGARRLRHLAEQ